MPILLNELVITLVRLVKYTWHGLYIPLSTNFPQLFIQTNQNWSIKIEKKTCFYAKQHKLQGFPLHEYP